MKELLTPLGVLAIGAAACWYSTTIVPGDTGESAAFPHALFLVSILVTIAGGARFAMILVHRFWGRNNNEIRD